MCSKINHKLTAITDTKELKELQKLYRKDWPRHCVGYFWLDNFLRWLEKDEKQIAFYTLDEDWRTDGLFLIVHRYQLFFANLSQCGTQELQMALELLDWSRGYKVSSIYESHHLLYKHILSTLGLSFEQEQKTIMYHLDCKKAKALDMSCPDGYFVQPLRLEHAAIINELWSSRHRGSLKLIQLLIKNNANVGVYKDDSKELCAWCLRLQSGFLGALEVQGRYKRQGLGAEVVGAMAKRISNELEQDVTALVSLSNIAAAKLFEKLGFTLRTDEHYYWSMSLPKIKGNYWPDN
ncbi:uncharacterized protein LOC115631312 [Scaptodrosophila lebanonensis]|uniref:Uncharacterized protein LOC115631312 n=1 Tax=Drosophila lebanonensis TaxID=7225 RepID=A0A6J2U5P5_DROLE|nr:uncharacterized protein LOC115631312 [Scaptodrosophila lebanonensis]